MSKDFSTSDPEDASKDALLGVYEQVCKSYHAIDDFRTKLLGLLPLSTLLGISLLSFQNKSAKESQASSELIAFISIFAAAFTLALFIYEIRGILRCNNLIQRGEEIEQSLNIKGQFYVCKDEHQRNQRNRPTNFFNAKLAACIIYSIVFSAWIYVALRLGFNVRIYGCVITALVAGLALSFFTYRLVKVWIAS